MTAMFSTLSIRCDLPGVRKVVKDFKVITFQTHDLPVPPSQYWVQKFVINEDRVLYRAIQEERVKPAPQLTRRERKRVGDLELAIAALPEIVDTGWLETIDYTGPIYCVGNSLRPIGLVKVEIVLENGVVVSSNVI
jgi:hypothetical protein